MADDLSQIHPDTIRAFEPGLAERTQSWNTVSSLSSTDHPSPSNVSPRPVNLLEKKGQKLLSEASEIQLWWDQEMCKELKLPPGYRKVGVLLIKWSSEIDEFKQRGEQEVRPFLTFNLLSNTPCRQSLFLSSFRHSPSCRLRHSIADGTNLGSKCLPNQG